jgi:hypothetical protein
VKPPEDCYITFYYPSPNGPALSSSSSPESCSTKKQQHAHAIPNHSCATFLTSLVSIQAGTTGLATWEAAYHLAEHLARNPQIVRRRSVLEFGAGTGLVGIVVARIQAEDLKKTTTDSQGKTESRLTMTDLDASVMERCRRNVFLPPSETLHGKERFRSDTLSMQMVLTKMLMFISISSIGQTFLNPMGILNLQGKRRAERNIDQHPPRISSKPSDGLMRNLCLGQISYVSLFPTVLFRLLPHHILSSQLFSPLTVLPCITR